MLANKEREEKRLEEIKMEEINQRLLREAKEAEQLLEILKQQALFSLRIAH